jgi:hypothetical protein
MRLRKTRRSTGLHHRLLDSLGPYRRCATHPDLLHSDVLSDLTSTSILCRVHVGNRSIDCTPTGSDKYGRTLALCRLTGDDLNAWIVREGWALAFTRYSKVYVAEEEQARRAQRGLWSGAFIAPWDWRHRNCKTEVLGALQVPINAQAILCSASDAPSPE